ncbi:alpha-galactosidase [Saccharothrix ecbatanensis]|uniref:Alpha-galactosidase n=1 Tax=Saccharothrix ecbatanensis TaxID=1105145 RepID=A0A7W9HKI2_9PSEU|nr:alpha-galactosidase [Saccharothrix ecbatanensis]MBB5803776.1 alpha-galactosidase [Saccharothrix ecbatanensis]
MPAVTRTTCAGRPAWLLRTARNAMLLSVADGGGLVLDHWGGDGGGLGDGLGGDSYLPHTPWNRPSQAHFLDGVPLAYSTYGDRVYKEPGLVVAREDGTSVSRLTWREDRIEDDVLTLVFEDAGLVVEHRFAVLADHGIVVRDVRVCNQGPSPLRVERVASAVLGLPPARYDSWTLHGRWGDEYQLTRRELAAGKVVIDSRRGFTSHEANPWFALTRAGEDGPVWFGALAWSGNWSIVFETERNDALHVVAGINPFDSAWHLEPGEDFRTPSLACGYTENGLDEAARVLHRYQRDHVLPARHRHTPPPVHYNTWLATAFDVEVEHQIALATQAAELGVELFVVDDGWFGARNDDHAGLGDWTVDPAKFPRGLDQLVDEVHRLGMRFGIWLEPEMVNPDSDLFRAHPDWVLHLPDREPTMSRNQLVLNFAREDVREGVLSRLRALLTDHRIDFVKWDHNRPYTEVGWPQAPHERRREVWVRHVRGVYEVIGRLRAEFPDLMIETCAGGGGRVDLGILGLTDMAQVSDNTDPGDRLRMQHGFSRAYAPRAMVGWVADTPEPTTGRITPLDFRFHVAMQGVLGISGDILRWSEDDRKQARELITEYKRLRPTIQDGDQHWLVVPSDNEPCAVQYVSRDCRVAVVFVYQVRGVAGEGPRRIRLRGLDADRLYRRDSDGVVTTGAALMAVGLSSAFPPPPPPGHTEDWRSRVELWQAVEETR